MNNGPLQLTAPNDHLDAVFTSESGNDWALLWGMAS